MPKLRPSWTPKEANAPNAFLQTPYVNTEVPFFSRKLSLWNNFHQQKPSTTMMYIIQTLHCSWISTLSKESHNTKRKNPYHSKWVTNKITGSSAQSPHLPSCTGFHLPTYPPPRPAPSHGKIWNMDTSCCWRSKYWERFHQQNLPAFMHIK